MKREYRVLIVDDNSKHLEEIEDALWQGVRIFMQRLSGGGERPEVVIDTETRAFKVATDIAEDRFRYNIVMADVLMPPEEGEKPTMDGGAALIFNAMNSRGSTFTENVLLVVMTAQWLDYSVKRFLNDLLDKQADLDNPWAIRQAKPESLVPPAGSPDSLEVSSWVKSLLDVVARYDDKEWRKRYIREVNYDVFRASRAAQAAMAAAVEYAEQGDDTIVISGPQGSGKEVIAEKYFRLLIQDEGARLQKVRFSHSDPHVSEVQLFGSTASFEHYRREMPSPLEEQGVVVFVDGLDVSNSETTENAGRLLRLIKDRTFERSGDSEARTFEGTLIFSVEDIDSFLRHKESDVRRLGTLFQTHPSHISLPALKDFPEDVPDMLLGFMKLEAKQRRREVVKFDDDALNLLKLYPWPGNVSELEGYVRRVLTSHNLEHLNKEDAELYLGRDRDKQSDKQQSTSSGPRPRYKTYGSASE